MNSENITLIEGGVKKTLRLLGTPIQRLFTTVDEEGNPNTSEVNVLTDMRDNGAILMWKDLETKPQLIGFFAKSATIDEAKQRLRGRLELEKGVVIYGVLTVDAIMDMLDVALASANGGIVIFDVLMEKRIDGKDESMPALMMVTVGQLMHPKTNELFAYTETCIADNNGIPYMLKVLNAENLVAAGGRQ